MNEAKLSELEKGTLDTFKNKVVALLGENVLEFRLFGSRARGQSHEDSDLDVLVLTAEATRQVKETIWDIANDLFLEKDVLISPLVMTREAFQHLLERERLIALDIQREGFPL